MRQIELTNVTLQLRFASGSLKQYLHVEYEKKFPETDSVKADNPETILYEFVPPSYSTLPLEFAKIVKQDAEEFKPLGTKIGAYKKRYQVVNGKGKGKATKLAVEKAFEVVKDDAADEEVVFEAYSSNWDTPGFKEFHRRMQVFVLLYIEGAQYIDEEDGRWEFVTLFVRSSYYALEDTDRICRFERRKVGTAFTYHFVGFVSFYSFFCWPDTKRLRLA